MTLTLDLRGITTKPALHALFKDQLGFPDWYGVSWDAFWDCILAVVEMPEQVTLVNWQEFAQASPKDMDILRKIIEDYAQQSRGKRILLG